MRRVETVFLGAVFGAVPIIVGFLASWWLSIPFVPEEHVFQIGLIGLGLGVITDLVFLMRFVKRAYSLKAWSLASIYVFYSMCFFGFFMGVPVFNVALAVPAGFYAGARLAHCTPRSEVLRPFRQTAQFTTSVLAFFAVASAYLALADSSTPANLAGMFKLPFAVTTPMIVMLILAGGAGILALQWLLTIWSAKLAYRYLAPMPNPPRV